MRLVLRRARGARTLLLAALVATVLAVSFVVGLLAYGQEVVAEAGRVTITSAPAEERAVLVRGAANAGGTTASVAWILEPDLAGAGLSELLDFTAALPTLRELPET